MNEQPGNVVLSGWVHPGECRFGSDDLYLLVVGTFAGQRASMKLRLVNALRHGLPCIPDDRIGRDFGDWLELAGTFAPSPIDDEDCDRDHAGYLTVTSAVFSTRQATAPAWRFSPGVSGKKITVYLSGAIRHSTSPGEPQPAP